jgi:prepilin-type N-terminal cleavage/methylation domain-containing protein
MPFSAQAPTSLPQGAFTLVEVIIALGVLATLAAGAFLGFNTINTYAASSRLYSQAQAVAQNQIDLILSKEPFDPTSNPPQIPAELALGTATKPNVFVYTDPVSGRVLVTGAMVTTVSDPGFTMTFNNATTNLNVRKVNVKVNYTFRNTDYTVSMDTLRTADR